MNEENFSPEQSLQLIQGMIEKAKQDITDKSKFFLLWGWLTITAILGQFILKVLVKSNQHYYVWFLMFIGMGISIYWGRSDRKKNKAKTYVDESMQNLWSGMGFSFFVMSILFVFIKGGWLFCYPFFILMYGMGTYVTGRQLKFRPFIIGGVLSWILSIISIQFDFDYQMLFAVAALLVSYIIPAYLLRIHQQKHKH